MTKDEFQLIINHLMSNQVYFVGAFFVASQEVTPIMGGNKLMGGDTLVASHGDPTLFYQMFEASFDQNPDFMHLMEHILTRYKMEKMMAIAEIHKAKESGNVN